MTITFRRSAARLARIAALLVPFVLAGCGGGSMYAGGGIVGTGSPASVISQGPISGFTSNGIVVNGKSFATAATAVQINGQSAPLTSLQVGMLVTVQGVSLPTGDVANVIQYRSDVEGPVSGVDTAAHRFTVLGQRVTVDRQTVFEGGTFDTLIDQFVEVSGFATAAGDILATRVAIRAAATRSVEVSGTVATLDTTRRTFSIAAQRVDYSALSASAVPMGLVEGSTVQVTGTLDAAQVLVASAIQLVPGSLPRHDASSVEVEGVISAFAGAQSFKVNGQSVDGRTATIEGGSAAMLGDGVLVEVEGSLTQGVVLATRILIEELVTVVIDGTVETVDSAVGTLIVGGQRIAITTTTQFVDSSAAGRRDFGLGAIVVGDRLSIRAARTANGLVAIRIERRDVGAAPPTDVQASASGVISDFVSIARFSVGGRPVNASSARFQQGAASDLANGKRVSVEGYLAEGVLIAAVLTFEVQDTTPVEVASAEGIVSDFVSIADFKVAGRRVDASAARFEGGTAADVANGRSVEVEGVVVGDALRATKVSIKPIETTTTLEVEGTIANFVTAASFTIAGQRVDASQAAIRNGTVRDLANGRRASASGPVVAGVLRAIQVTLEDAPEQQEASVQGTITNFVSAANFTVAGRVVDASSATFENGKVTDLANGRRVDIEGVLAGTVLRAKKVSFE